MQMISAVKMQKSVKLVAMSKAYSAAANEILEELKSLEKVSHPFFAVATDSAEEIAEEDTQSNVELLLFLSSNRGLSGSFNSNLLKVATAYLKTAQQDKNTQFKVIAVGKNAAKFAKRNNLELIALYDKINENPTFAEARIIALPILDLFNSKTISKVTLISTDYVSSFTQTARSKQLLPIDLKSNEVNQEAQENIVQKGIAPILEPNPEDLLNYLLPKLLETQIYQAILESAAAEHSSRMVAMKNATDSATDIIGSLTLEFNKSRQASITKELAEIVSGADSLDLAFA